MAGALTFQANIPALETTRHMENTQKSLQRNLERLSTGKRINSAADDSAGLGISVQMNARVRSLAQAERNINSAITMVSLAEAGVAQWQDLFTRMREIAVQSANGTLTSTDRLNLDNEFTALKSELIRVSDVTTWKGATLLGGATIFEEDFQVGPDNGAAANVISTSTVFGGGTSANFLLDSYFVSGSTSAAALNAIVLIDA